MSRSVVALLGAECTGKSTLAKQLHDGLARQGRRVALVGDALDEFCARQGRRPRAGDLASIAAEQSRRIDAAACEHEFVIADTTALMTAVHGDETFADARLLSGALREQAGYALTLLLASDLPWVADGQREGLLRRGRIEARLRAALGGAGIGYAVIRGDGEARLVAAQAALAAHGADCERPCAASGAWRHWCAECGDADCERHLFRRPGRTDVN